VIAEILVRVDEELAHQPVDVTGLRIRFAEQVVVADDDRDRQVVFEHRRPHCAVAHLAHVPLRAAGAEARAQQRADDQRAAECESDAEPLCAARRRCGLGRPLQQQAVLALGNDDLRVAAGGARIEVFEAATQLVHVDSRHRILRTLAEHLQRDLRFLRRLAFERARQQVVEEPRQRAGLPQQPARTELLGMADQLVIHRSSGSQ